jgi:hypothetical protein
MFFGNTDRESVILGVYKITGLKVSATDLKLKLVRTRLALEERSPECSACLWFLVNVDLAGRDGPGDTLDLLRDFAIWF